MATRPPRSAKLSRDSIVNAALPTIQGEVGASGSEGTWIATAYLVAEIIAIPLTAWLERLFGLRLVLIVATIAFVSFSLLCGTADTLSVMGTMDAVRAALGVVYPGEEDA